MHLSRSHPTHQYGYSGDLTVCIINASPTQAKIWTKSWLSPHAPTKFWVMNVYIHQWSFELQTSKKFWVTNVYVHQKSFELRTYAYTKKVLSYERIRTPTKLRVMNKVTNIYFVSLVSIKCSTAGVHSRITNPTLPDRCVCVCVCVHCSPVSSFQGIHLTPSTDQVGHTLQLTVLSSLMQCSLPISVHMVQWEAMLLDQLSDQLHMAMAGSHMEAGVSMSVHSHNQVIVRGCTTFQKTKR